MRQPGWEGSLGGMDACVCWAESLRHSPETVTASITGCTPLQHVFGVKKEGKKESPWSGPWSSFSRPCLWTSAFIFTLKRVKNLSLLFPCYSIRTLWFLGPTTLPGGQREALSLRQAEPRVRPSRPMPRAARIRRDGEGPPEEHGAGVHLQRPRCGQVPELGPRQGQVQACPGVEAWDSVPAPFSSVS